MATPPGPRTGATIYSVAERAGVSIATVSRVLQGSAAVAEETRRRVLEAAEELDYVPLGAARSLAVRHHEAHGLLLPELSGPYHCELLRGFESRSGDLGQAVVLMVAEGKQDLLAALRALATRVDGVAVLGSPAIPDEVVGALRGSKPVVVVAGDGGPGVDAVVSENTGSSHSMTLHVLGHGRSRLLFVGDPASCRDVRERYAGFVAAHEEVGLAAAEPERVALREGAGRQLGDRVLAGVVTADALVCADDQLALAVMQRLREGGVTVPDDVAVTGWDDVAAAGYGLPGLTTVRQPVRELGALAAERLHERVTGSAVPDGPKVVPTELVIRSSCGCTAAPAPAR